MDVTTAADEGEEGAACFEDRRQDANLPRRRNSNATDRVLDDEADVDADNSPAIDNLAYIN